MRIYIKTEEGKKIRIPVPMWAIKTGNKTSHRENCKKTYEGKRC